MKFCVQRLTVVIGVTVFMAGCALRMLPTEPGLGDPNKISWADIPSGTMIVNPDARVIKAIKFTEDGNITRVWDVASNVVYPNTCSFSSRTISKSKDWYETGKYELDDNRRSWAVELLKSSQEIPWGVDFTLNCSVDKDGVFISKRKQLDGGCAQVSIGDWRRRMQVNPDYFQAGAVHRLTITQGKCAGVIPSIAASPSVPDLGEIIAENGLIVAIRGTQTNSLTHFVDTDRGAYVALGASSGCFISDRIFCGAISKDLKGSECTRVFPYRLKPRWKTTVVKNQVIYLSDPKPGVCEKNLSDK